MTAVLFFIGIIGFYLHLNKLYRIIKNKPNPDLAIKINYQELNRIYGVQLEIRKGIVISLPCVEQWYTMLRQTHSVFNVRPGSLAFKVHSDFIIKTHDDFYFHILIETCSNGHVIPVITTTVQYKNSLNEARVRTALFNDKQSYMQAFGELPKSKTRSQIKT